MSRYAIIENGIVTNIVLWDGQAEWSNSAFATPIPAGQNVGIGSTYDGTTWTAPPGPSDAGADVAN